MKEKPKMYQNRIYKEFNNNKLVYKTSETNMNKNNVWTTNDIRKKINNIINSPSFIYRTKVTIELKDEIITRKIVGIYNNNLVTIDNEHIPIDIIEDIYLYKEK